MDDRLRIIEHISLHRRLIAIGFGAVLLTSAVAISLVEPEEQFCTAEGRIGPNGQIYGRDPSQGCQFVDEDGNVVSN